MGEGKMRHAINFDTFYSPLDLFTTGNYFVEGVTIVDPNGYCISASRLNGKVKNVKCFGFKYSTDGVGASSSLFTSTVKNSFFKVNDDSLKLYGSNTIYEDIVLFT
jgi:hypothetical protein